MVMAILGIIIGAIAMAFLASGHSSADTVQRLKESHDAQLASAYLATDVQSAQSLSSSTCPSTGLPGMTNLVNFKYDNPNFSTASWYYGPSGGEQQVVRSFCVSGDNVLSSAPVVHQAGAAPSVACYSRTSLASELPSTPCSNGSKPTKVTISFFDHNSLTNSDDYSFKLSGTRRNQAATNLGNTITSYPSILANSPPGAASCLLGTQVNLSGSHVTLHVNGDIVVNSCSSGAVSTSSSNFSCGDLSIYSGGSLSGSAASCPTNTSPYQLPDPLAGLSAPNLSGLTTNPAPSGGVYTQGIYTATFSPSGTLSPGIYVLQAGLCIAGNQSLQGSGVFLYITGGAPSCGGNAVGISGNGVVSLSPPTGGAYGGITIWSTSAAPLSISGNGSGTSIGGVIYAPNASLVTLGGGNGNLLIGSVIAPYITVQGGGSSGAVCVGYTGSTCP
jgi:hypothetical protein